MKTTKKNSLEIVRRAEDKLASSKLVRARLWERVPGKERLYLEPTSLEAVREAAGYCSKADLRRMGNAYVEASTLSFHGLTEDDAPRAVKREVQAALAEAEAELEAEAKAAAPLTEDEIFELSEEELAAKAARLQATAAVEAPEAAAVEAPAESFEELEPEAPAEPASEPMVAPEGDPEATELEPLPAPALEALEAPVSTVAHARTAVRAAAFARRAVTSCAESSMRYNNIITHNECSRGGAMNEKKTTTISDELEAAVTRTEAAVAALPEDRPLTREQLAAVVEERCVEALSFEAEARSLPAALRAALMEPGEHEVSLGALAEGLQAAEEATRELRSGSLAAASEQYGQAQRLLECAGLLGCFAWAPRFAGELSRWAALAAGKTACEGLGSELPDQPLYDAERRLLDSGDPVFLSEGWLWPVEA